MAPQRFEEELTFAGDEFLGRFGDYGIIVRVELKISRTVAVRARGHDLNIVSSLSESLNSVPR